MKSLFYKGFTLIFIVLMVLFLNWFNHPDLQYEGEKEVLGISSSVDVYTDSFGVPHVFAKNDFRGSASDWLPWFRAENRARLKNMFAGWEDLIEKYQCGIAEIALAWTTAKPGVTHTLCGIRTVKQAMQNARAGSIVLEEQDIKRLNNDIKKLGSP